MLIKFLLEDILNFHSQLEDKSTGVRDLGLIESAVNAPFQTFGGQDLYPTIFDKAAQLAYGLTENHGFVDGNKRIGALVLLTLLELNGYPVKATNAEFADIIMGVAASEKDEEDLMNWVEAPHG